MQREKIQSSQVSNKYNFEKIQEFHVTNEILFYEWKYPFAMIDIDVPDSAHCEMQVTFENKGDAIVYAKNIARENMLAIEIYETVGGIRIFVMNKELYPREAFSLFQEADPFYSMMCENKRGYSARLSPKPRRMNDYVTKHVEEFNPSSDKEIKLFRKILNKMDLIIEKKLPIEQVIQLITTKEN